MANPALPLIDPGLDSILFKLINAPRWAGRKYLRRNGYPRFLYKYRAVDPKDADSLKRLADVIVESKLWLSSPEDFNDPFDMAATLTYDGTPEEKRVRHRNFMKLNYPNLARAERERRVTEMMARPQATVLKGLEDAFAKNRKATGVYSFAGDPRNIQMWSHYAANHQGLCLQFDLVRDPMVFLHATAVHYEPDEYPSVNWVKNVEEQLGVALLRKHKGWAYEAERRIIKPNAARTYEPFNAAALRGIIFGCRASEELEEAVRNLLEKRTKRGRPPVKVYTAQRHPSEYALRIT
jgi:hypothetical protein